MTDVLKFWFTSLGEVVTAVIDCKYEIFGFEVSFFEITLGLFILCVGINFFRFSTDDMSIMRDRMSRAENKADKNKEYIPKHSYKPRHIKYNFRTDSTESISSKVKNYFSSSRHGGSK